MALHAADGSVRIAIDTGTPAVPPERDEYADAVGVYCLSGGYRINTTDAGPGLYAADGAYRAYITDATDVAPGSGRYAPDGALRLAVVEANDNEAFTVDIYDQPGQYAKDGSLKVTIINP